MGRTTQNCHQVYKHSENDFAHANLSFCTQKKKGRWRLYVTPKPWYTQEQCKSCLNLIVSESCRDLQPTLWKLCHFICLPFQPVCRHYCTPRPLLRALLSFTERSVHQLRMGKVGAGAQAPPLAADLHPPWKDGLTTFSAIPLKNGHYR